MKATAKPTRGKTASKTAKYYEAKIELLEEENEILRNALEELKSELEEAKEEAAANDEETRAAWEEVGQIEKMYIAARSLVNIPDTIKELVFELIKSRFLIFDKIADYGGGLLNTYSDGSPIVEKAGEFEFYTDILPPAEILRKSKDKRKK